jgi:general secretion pathway protein G
MMKNKVNTKSRKAKSGFTLIEIMLVIVIIGIIVGIAAPKIGGKLGKAQNIAARAGLRAVETAIQSYEMDHLRLPDSLEDLTKQSDGKGPYLKPSELVDPWSTPYVYVKGGSHGIGFDLSTVSPDGKEFNNWD